MVSARYFQEDRESVREWITECRMKAYSTVLVQATCQLQVASKADAFTLEGNCGQPQAPAVEGTCGWHICQLRLKFKLHEDGTTATLYHVSSSS